VKWLFCINDYCTLSKIDLLWVVSTGTRGLFSENSKIPEVLWVLFLSECRSMNVFLQAHKTLLYFCTGFIGCEKFTYEKLKITIFVCKYEQNFGIFLIRYECIMGRSSTPEPLGFEYILSRGFRAKLNTTSENLLCVFTTLQPKSTSHQTGEVGGWM